MCGTVSSMLSGLETRSPGPNVLSPRDLVSRPDNMDETVPHTHTCKAVLKSAPDDNIVFGTSTRQP